MERRINSKISVYLSTFKNDIKEQIMKKLEDSDGTITVSDCNELILYLYDYDGIEFSTEDFVKRKRVKNIVPVTDRCCAKRANNEQCTRRRKEGHEYCGTHVKGTPNGFMENEGGNIVSETTKVEVWAQDIRGISYYLDNMGNVYEAEDVVMNKDKPTVIASYQKSETGEYIIPDLGIM